MLPKMTPTNQPNLFYGSLMDMLDRNDPLIALADAIDWKSIEEALRGYYALDKGRPAKPLRLMAGLLMLKYVENLSDENVVVQWKRNPYYQYFCGLSDYQCGLPCDATELVKFRNRIGQTGVDAIFGASVTLHPEASQEAHVIIDSTAQEKNITYPTDGKLAIKMIHALHKIAKREGIALRRTYLKEIKAHRITLRFFRHPKKKHKARSAMKRLRTITGVLMRDMERSFTQEQRKSYAEQFSLYTQVLAQKRNDKDKIYSLHEPHIYAMAKGKDHKSYEFGVKSSVATTYTHGIVVGAVAHETHEHDSKTLEAVLTHASTHRHAPIQKATCDRGYRGVKEVNTTHICIPGIQLKRDTKEEKEQKRKQFRRRAAVEPTIGHLKHDHRMVRNYLKGFIGDQINLLMAACAWNLKKWMNFFIHALFLAKDYRQVMVSMERIKLYGTMWIWLEFTQRESRL